MISAVPHIAAMESYPLSNLSLPAGVKPIYLSQNESLRPPSPSVFAALSRVGEELSLYPDPNWAELKETIANVHSIEKEQILCGAGSMELIGCLAKAFLDENNALLTSEYSYAYCQTAANFSNARHDVALEENYTVSVENLLELVKSDTRIVFVANPGNPTGTRITTAKLMTLRAELPDDVLLIIDEAYGEFADNIDDPTFPLVAKGNTVVLRTLSKAYGLAGARVGWGCFPPKIAEEVRKVLNPNNIALTSQIAAQAAMTDQTYMRETCSLTDEIKQQFYARLESSELSPIRSFSNFILLPLEDAEHAQKLDEHMRTKGVIVRGMGGYGLPHCVRITIGKKESMEFVAKQIDSFLKQGTVGC